VSVLSLLTCMRICLTTRVLGCISMIVWLHKALTLCLVWFRLCLHEQSLAPRFQSLIAKDPHADVRAMWQQFKQLKVRNPPLFAHAASSATLRVEIIAFA